MNNININSNFKSWIMIEIVAELKMRNLENSQCLRHLNNLELDIKRICVIVILCAKKSLLRNSIEIYSVSVLLRKSLFMELTTFDSNL